MIFFNMSESAFVITRERLFQNEKVFVTCECTGRQEGINIKKFIRSTI